MVVLFFWLLIQVLFTKQLEIHLQVLLLVGLVIFCLCLLLGCFICWKKSHIYSSEDKEAGTSQPTPSDPATFAPNPAPPPHGPAASSSTSRRLQTPGSITKNWTVIFWNTRPRSPALRRPRENSKTQTLKNIPKHSSHTSLPVFPKFFSKTCRAAQRRCTVTGADICNENSRLTSPGSVSPSMPEEPIPLTPLSYGSLSPKPCLHFTMAFSTEQQALTVTVLRITGTLHKLEDVSIRGSLPPLYPCPVQATAAQSSLCLQPPTLTLLLRVNSVRELQWCVLRIGVYVRDVLAEGDAVLGELEAECAGRDWKNDQMFYLTKELNQTKGVLKTGLKMT
ncbi:hypothetical protein WMY93_031767 [Mugilogobius chulae]|uniref:Uncharacterized protein n=1 Tax=Mugilogobius chulae TaxID=88201 RepID=A0AAW0MFK3_9GOBI